MICAFAAAAALSSQNPAHILSGNYHPTAHNANLLDVVTGYSTGGKGLPLNGDALTVALDVVQAWAVMLTICFTLIIFFFLAFCVCAKRENSYNDFENTQGITTVKVCRNGGENGVHIAPIGSSTIGSPRATDETSEASSRYTHQRELPAIPTNASRSNREAMQTRSTVNDSGQGGGSVKLVGGVQVLPAASMKSGGRAAVVKESVAISIDARDGGKKNVPAASYVMVSHSKKEHAYAKVVHGNAQEPETDTDNYDDPQVLTKDSRGQKSDILQKSSNILTSQTSKNRSSMVSNDSASDRTSSVAPGPQPAVVIPAAMAISGQTRANEELPYMTPPALQQGNTQSQQNYSGDSHDSRGYTSISVREPLAALKARQQQENRPTAADPTCKRQEPETEGYYMTVSDDSADETYACIDENARNGGSETYARINLPPSTAASHSASSPLSPTAQESSPPAPPSVDSLKHVVHSRQASAGSAASTGLSSPNAERRATKSPLPPVPQGDPDHYSKDTTDKPTSEAAESTGDRPLEEMYAKVNKKRSSHSRGNSSGAPDEGVLSNNSSRRSSADISRQLGSPTATKLTTMTASLTSPDNTRNQGSDMSWSGASAPAATNVTAQTKTYSRETSDPGYETVKSENYPNYEVVRHQGASDLDSEHGYETLRHKESESGYETVQEVNKSNRTPYDNRDYEAGYETVNRTAGYESVRSAGKSGYDPGYEELSGDHARTASDCDPNYEQLKFSSNSESGYESVNKRAEGNYELVSDYDTQDRPLLSDTGVPLYATVNKKNKISPVEDQPRNKTAADMADELFSKSNENEHISLIQINDDHSSLEAVGKGHTDSTPLITGATAKRSPESLNLVDLPDKVTYPVMDSPEDVELPPPPEGIETLAELSGTDASSSLAQETANLLGSFAEVIDAAKTLDVDLITGCYTNTGKEMASLIPTHQSNSSNCEADLLVSDPGMHIDLLPESLPPPPTSLIDESINQMMALPPPVDDICGNSDLINQLTSSASDTMTCQTAHSGLSAELSELIQPPPFNGTTTNGLESVDFPSLMDVPPPPQLDAIEASLALTNTITVTVNPMAQIQHSPAPPPVSSLIRAALSSESSVSTANGGSVESVVSVDVKHGIEVSTASTPQVAQAPSQSITSSEGKDSQDGLTPV